MNFLWQYNLDNLVFHTSSWYLPILLLPALFVVSAAGRLHWRLPCPVAKALHLAIQPLEQGRWGGGNIGV